MLCSLLFVGVCQNRERSATEKEALLISVITLVLRSSLTAFWLEFLKHHEQLKLVATSLMLMRTVISFSLFSMMQSLVRWSLGLPRAGISAGKSS
jgi:hypothetical protein